jgi:cell division protein FtsB
LLGLQLRLWQPGGLFSAYRLQKKVATQTGALAAVQTRNQRLVAQLKWLHHSTDAVEHHARQSLGMIKPGETFYLLVEKD